MRGRRDQGDRGDRGWPDRYNPQRISAAMTSEAVVGALLVCVSASMDGREDSVLHAVGVLEDLDRNELASLALAMAASLSTAMTMMALVGNEDPFDVMARFAAGFTYGDLDGPGDGSTSEGELG